MTTGHAEAEPGRLLGAIFASSPDAVVVVDAAGNIVLANRAVTGLFGYYPEELVGASVATLVPVGLRPVHAANLEGFFHEPHARQMGAGLRLRGRHRDGTEFAVDVSLAPVEVEGRPYAAAFVRDATERERAVSRLRTVNEVTQGLLAGIGTAEVLETAAASARALNHSDAVWVVLPDPSGELSISVVDGPGTELLLGETLSPDTSRSAGVMRSGASELVADLSTAPNVPAQCAALDLGPGLYAPLVAESRRLGALVFGRRHGQPEFSPLDIAFAEVFASAITAAIEVGETRTQLEELTLVAEEERIARDLHDTVIQRLFALGMTLQALRMGVPGPLGDRIDEIVDELDDVIRQIRSTIFRLPARHRASPGLREAMLTTAEDLKAQLGFAPRLAFEGPVDTVVPEPLAEQVLAVFSEGLSNVARHAEASMAEAVVSVGDGRLTLVLLDDGVGVGAGPSAGNGLRNIVRRAEELSGHASIRRRDPRGTIVEWSVPLHPAGEDAPPA